MTFFTRILLAAAGVTIVAGLGGVFCDAVASKILCDEDDDVSEMGIFSLQLSSTFFRWISVMTMAFLAVGLFVVYGFGWFILAGVLAAITLRAVLVIFATLFVSGMKPLPKWFDVTMYEALAAGALIVPSLIIGVIFALV